MQDNAIALDNVTIYEPVTRTPSVKVSKVGPFDFTVDAGVEADSYNVKIAQDTLAFNAPVGVAPNEARVLTSFTSNTRVFTVPDSLYRGTFVNVYVQAVKNGNAGLWSEPARVQVPLRMTLPVTYSFEEELTNGYKHQDRANRVWYTSSSYYNAAYVMLDPNYGHYSYMPRSNSAATYAVTGGNVLYYYYGGYGVCFPYVDTVQNVMMSWYDVYTSTSAGNAVLEVGVIDYPNDFSTFTKVAEFTPEYSVKNKRLIGFNSYHGNGHYVAFRTRSITDAAYYYAYIDIDDVSFQRVPDCMFATNYSVSPDAFEAEINWSTGGSTDWVVKYALDSLMTNKDTVVAHTSLATEDVTTTTINGLSSLTKYWYSIGVVCNADTTWSDVASFTTACPPAMELPYLEDFNSYKGYSSYYYGYEVVPTCWTMPQYHYSTYAYGYAPFITTSSSYVYQGQSFAFGSYYGSATTSWSSFGPLYFALPKFNAPIGQLAVSFMYRVYSASATYYASVTDTIEVGVMTDPEDLSTFTPWKAMYITATTASTTYQEYSMDFYGYNGPDGYIAIRRNTPSSNYHVLFMDNLEVKQLTGCMNVDEVDVKGVSFNGIDLEISTRMGNTFEVAVHSAQVADEANIGTGSSLVFDSIYTTTLAAVSSANILPANTYYAYVRTLCSETDFSEWYGPIEFNTPCEPYTVESFNSSYATLTSNDQLLCWVKGLRSGTTNIPSFNANYGGSVYLYNNAASDGAYLITPELKVDSIKNYSITFRGVSSSSTATYCKDITVGVITDPYDLSTFYALETFTMNYLSASATARMTAANEYTVYLSNYKGDYNDEFGKHIMLIMESGDAIGQLYVQGFHVDSLTNCEKPIQVKALVGVHDATVTWTGTSQRYQVLLTSAAINTVNIDNNVVVMDTIVSGASVLFEDLLASNTYYVYVRPVCGNDFGDWSYEYSFTTECEAFHLPYEEDFSTHTTGTSGTFPSCWKRYHEGSSTVYPYVSTYGNGDAKSMYMYYSSSYKVYAVMPQPAESISNMTLSFDYRASSGTPAVGTIIGVSKYAAPFDSVAATFEPLDTLTSLSTNWAEKTVDFSTYQGEGEYIVFKANGTTTYIDNISVNPFTTCERPTALNMKEIGTNYAEISWSGVGTNFDIFVFDGVDSTYYTSTDTTYRITGLHTNTEYKVGVRQNCGGSSYPSRWLKTTFNTLIGVPYEELFQNGIPSNWSRHQQLASEVFTNGGTLTTATTTSGWGANSTTNGLPYNHIKANVYGTSAKYWFVSPSICLGEDHNLVLAFDAALTDYSNASPITSDEKGTTGVDDKFMVIISADNGQTWLEANATVWDNTGNADYVYNNVPYNGQRYYISLEPYRGDTIRFAFYEESTVTNADNDFHIGNVSIQVMNCDGPTGLMAIDSLATINTATLKWDADSTASYFHLLVVADDDTAFNQTVSGSSAVVTGLQKNTLYTAYLAKPCDGGGLSERISTTFSTALAAPMSESFENGVPTGWKTYKQLINLVFNGTPLDTIHSPTRTNGWYPYSSPNGLSYPHIVTDVYSTDRRSWIVSPTIYVDTIENLMLSFDAAFTHYNNNNPADGNRDDDRFVVAISDDNGATWRRENAVEWNNAGTGDYVLNSISNEPKRLHIDMTKFWNKAIRIAFYTESTITGGDNDFHLGHMTLEAEQVCWMPQGLKVIEDSLDAHNMAFSWTGKGTPLYGYEFLCGDTTLFADTTSATMLAFHDLRAMTAYTMRVRTVCDSAEYSDWAELTRKTECDLFTPEQAAWDFTNLNNVNELTTTSFYPACWTVGNEHATTTTYTPYIYPTGTLAYTAGYDDKYGLRFANYVSGTTNSTRAYAILPEMIGDLDTLQISFWARAGYQSAASGTYTDYGYVGAAQGHTLLIGTVVDDDITTFQQLAEWTYPEHASSVSNLITTKDPEGTNYWREVHVPLYGGTGTRVCLMLAHTGTTYDYMFLDNIAIEPCHCVSPQNVQVLNVLPDLVDLTWTAPADSFYVAVGSDTIKVDTNYVALTNLVGDSLYTVAIAAKCDDGLSLWTKTTFTTPCSYATPDSLGRYFWNFDSRTVDVHRTAHATADTYVIPNCWRSGNTGSVSYSYEPYIYPTSTTSAYVCGFDGKYSLYLYGTGANRCAYAIMPPVDGLDTLQLSFWARAGYQSNATGSYTDYSSSGYGHSLIIGSVTNPYDISTFDTLQIWTAPEHAARVTSLSTTPDPAGTNYWRKVNVNLSSIKGKYIVFMLPKSTVTSDYMFIDNVQILPAVCFMPDSAKVTDVTAHSANVQWWGIAEKYHVTVGDIDTITTANSLALTGLTSNTTYAVSVKAVCDSVTESDPMVLDFTTHIVLPYAENFADGIPTSWTRYQQLASDVFTAGHITASAVTSGWIVNTTTNGLPYNHVKGNIYGTSFKYWFVSPSIPLDSTPNLALAFDAALTDYNNGDPIFADANGPTGTDDKFMVVISEDNGATWSAANATVWDNTGNADYVYNDVPYNGDRYYIDLSQYLGKTIRFAFYGESTTSNADNDFHIGNVTVQAESCRPVRKLQSSYDMNGVSLKWIAESDSFQVQVATDESFADSLLVVDAHITDTAYSFIAALNATYYYRVRAICDSLNASVWANGSLVTPRAIRFYEGINEAMTVPEGWTRTYNKVLEEAATGLGTSLTETSTYSQYGWRYMVAGEGIASTHLRVAPYTSAKSLWIATPEIYLGAPDSIMLSFTYALTAYTSAAAPTLKGNEQFAVVVSADGGLTWDIANATVWAESADADHSFAAIPTTATRQVVDLSRYAGQTVKVAFYAFGDQTNAPNYGLHIDDIQINTYDGVNIHQDLCEYVNFVYGDVTIDQADLPLGESVWHQFIPSRTNGVKDTYNTFNINVNASVTTPLNDRVCYGEPYTKYGFNIASVTEEGLYKLKLQGVNTCDSIVELNLAIIPASVGTDSATICTGSSYMWNGHELSIAGLYADTLVAPSTGCDSIVSFRLFTNDPSETNETVYLCPGATLDFNGQVITTPGDYHYTTTNVHGCDSIVTWHVLAGKVETTHIRHLLCAGETYTDDNFVGIAVAGDYTVTIPSVVSGCDSILNLHLVAVQNGEATDQVEPADLPYQLDNVTIPAGTAPGTYDFTVNTTCGNVTLHVVVKGGDGIDNVRFANLNLAPNPTEVGKEVKILSSFAPGEKFVLEVFDATGAAVYREPVTATRAAITVPGMPVAGIYMVRLTGNDVTYQSKLIVK